jgi:hypothetical protein
MAKPKTFFEQVPLEVVKKIVGADICVNHGVERPAAVRKPKNSKRHRAAPAVKNRRGAKR